MILPGQSRVNPLDEIAGQRTNRIDYEALIARLGLMAAGAYLLLIARDVAPFVDLREQPGFLVIDLFTYAFGFALLLTGAISRVPVRHAGTIVLVSVLAGLSLSYYARIGGRDGYSTDVAVFTHSAVDLVLRGENPYAVRSQEFLVSQAERFDLPPFLITRLEDGRLIDRLMVYPAGHVLAFVPLLAVGIDDVRWPAAGALLAIVCLLWWQAPPEFRPLVVLPVLVDPAMSIFYPAGGVIDQVWLVPLMGTVIALNRGRFGWAALLFGLAASIKQTPWPLAPFLLIWLWYESSGLDRRDKVRVLVRFAGVSSAVFLLVNLPFMVWGFSDWFSAITFHLHVPLAMLGTGLVNLTNMGFIELSRDVYSRIAAAVLLTLLVLYARFFPRLKHTVWLYPGIVLWFTYRSLQSYFIVWTPLLLLSILVAYRYGAPEGHPAERD